MASGATLPEEEAPQVRFMFAFDVPAMASNIQEEQRLPPGAADISTEEAIGFYATVSTAERPDKPHFPRYAWGGVSKPLRPVPF